MSIECSKFDQRLNILPLCVFFPVGEANLLCIYITIVWLLTGANLMLWRTHFTFTYNSCYVQSIVVESLVSHFCSRFHHLTDISRTCCLIATLYFTFKKLSDLKLLEGVYCEAHSSSLILKLKNTASLSPKVSLSGVGTATYKTAILLFGLLLRCCRAKGRCKGLFLFITTRVPTARRTDETKVGWGGGGGASKKTHKYIQS